MTSTAFFASLLAASLLNQTPDVQVMTSMDEAATAQENTVRLESSDSLGEMVNKSKEGVLSDEAADELAQKKREEEISRFQDHSTEMMTSMLENPKQQENDGDSEEEEGEDVWSDEEEADEEDGRAAVKAEDIDPREYVKQHQAVPGEPTILLKEEDLSLGIPRLRKISVGFSDHQSSSEPPAAAAPAEQNAAASSESQPTRKKHRRKGRKQKSAAAAAVTDFKPFNLDVVILGEEQGELAEINCRDESGDSNTYDYASSAAFLKAIFKRSQDQGMPQPIVMGIGDTIFPGTFANYLSAKGDSGKKELAELIGMIPYDIMGIGNHDLGPRRSETQAYFSTAREIGLPYMVANISCTAGSNSLCGGGEGTDGGSPYKIIERGGLKIGLTTIVDPSVALQIAKDRLIGIEILPPKPALKKIVAKMRSEGANLVVAILHQGIGKSSAELERSLDGIYGLDLLVTDKLFKGDDTVPQQGRPAFTSMGQIVEPRTRTRIIGAGGSKNAATLITLSVDRDDFTNGYRIRRALPRSIGTALFSPDEEVKARIQSASGGFCAEWGKPLSDKATLSRDFSEEDLALFALNVMRFTAETEVAFINTGALRNQDRYPLKGTLSKADIQSSLPFGGHLITARISGADLIKLCGSIGAGLSAAGITKTDSGSFMVNGRPLDKKRRYTIALNEFLAEGSGGFIDPKKLSDISVWNDGLQTPHPDDSDEKAENGGEEKSSSPESGKGTQDSAAKQAEAVSKTAADDGRNPALNGNGPMLSSIVSDAISEKRFMIDNGDGTFSISPDAGFPNLHFNMLWLLGGYLNASYSHMIIHNPNKASGYDGDYDKSRLTATATDHLNIDFKLMANGSTRNHGWDNDFIIQYASTREKGPDETNAFSEDKDIVRLRSAYKYLGQRADMGDLWYVPVPFVEAQAETELTPSSDSENHPLDLTGIAGILLKLHKNLEYKLGINTKIDALEANAQPSVGLFTGYRLLRTDLFEINDHPIQFESEAEYFFNSVGRNRIHEFRWENRLFYKFTENISLTASFNMYIYKTKEVGEVGRAMEAMAGLNVAFERMIQQF